MQLAGFAVRCRVSAQRATYDGNSPAKVGIVFRVEFNLDNRATTGTVNGDNVSLCIGSYRVMATQRTALDDLRHIRPFAANRSPWTRRSRPTRIQTVGRI
jgi:hypothetical protein